MINKEGIFDLQQDLNKIRKEENRLKEEWTANKIFKLENENKTLRDEIKRINEWIDRRGRF